MQHNIPTKNSALKLRKKGMSLKEIKDTLNIPKSTLSGWFKNIILTKRQSCRLHIKKYNSLKYARSKALIINQQKKQTEKDISQKEIDHLLMNMNCNEYSSLLTNLSMLYLGEGFKKTGGTGMGNTNPLILKFFIKSMEQLFSLDRKRFRYRLHLRADQNEDKLLKFWTEQLCVSRELFMKSAFDKRTVNIPTYYDYKGVCVVNCGNIAIQRKLMYLSEQYCHRVISSVG